MRGCLQKVPPNVIISVCGYESSPKLHSPPSNASKYLASPAIIPIGIVPPTTLPKVEISGLIPNISLAPPLAHLKPVIISSKIRATPNSCVTSLSSLRNSIGTKSGLLLCTGSTKTPAIF